MWEGLFEIERGIHAVEWKIVFVSWNWPLEDFSFLDEEKNIAKLWITRNRNINLHYIYYIILLYFLIVSFNYKECAE